MSPAVAGRYPMMALSSEVLPEPLAPSMTQCWPFSMVQSTQSTITVPARSIRTPARRRTGFSSCVDTSALLPRLLIGEKHGQVLVGELLERAFRHRSVHRIFQLLRA